MHKQTLLKILRSKNMLASVGATGGRPFNNILQHISCKTNDYQTGRPPVAPTAQPDFMTIFS